MVERVARALFEQHLAKPETQGRMRRDGPLGPYEAIHDQWKEILRADARAVIAAMRDEANEVLRLARPEDAAMGWVAMIDAALEEAE